MNNTPTIDGLRKPAIKQKADHSLKSALRPRLGPKVPDSRPVMMGDVRVVARQRPAPPAVARRLPAAVKFAAPAMPLRPRPPENLLAQKFFVRSRTFLAGCLRGYRKGAAVLASQGTKLVLALSLFLAFGSGMWYAASTPKSQAVAQTAVSAIVPASSPIPLADAPAGTEVPKDALFNTPLDLLQSYFTPPPTPDTLAIRQAQLRKFLREYNSPLEPQADLIAEQPHWKLILAISFAESTLGKHCYVNNCSGIGGSNIRTYKSLDNWILDFNRLIEMRYKDQTLEQMCGVYVQPCTPSWLNATKQILSALDEAKIE